MDSSYPVQRLPWAEPLLMLLEDSEYCPRLVRSKASAGRGLGPQPDPGSRALLPRLAWEVQALLVGLGRQVTTTLTGLGWLTGL